MVFALIAMEDLRGVSGTVDVAVVTIGLTVLASVVLHGLTAQPLVARYAAGRVVEPSAPSVESATVVPVRHLVRPIRTPPRDDPPA